MPHRLSLKMPVAPSFESLKDAGERRLPDEPDRQPQLPVFAQLYQEHFDFVWRSARRLGVGDTAIEDFVQEVFMIVFRRLPAFEGRSSLRTWLYGIVLRAVREYHRVTFRANARRASSSENLWQTETQADARALPDEQVAQAQAVRILEEVLDELAPERREVFVMAELEQMTIPEIASLTGEKTNTVYSRLRLAREEFERSTARRRARDARRTP
jgi:RNA polymerase sigma-70 factor (ECF subfamily)